MNQQDLIEKVHASIGRQVKQRSYATPVDVLMDIGVLTQAKYTDWRNGRVDYLERVCTCNLHELSFIIKQLRAYVGKAGLKPSFCYYKQWGGKKNGHSAAIPLRFSKTGNPEIEKAYATHYVDVQRVEELKRAKANAPS